MLSSYRVLDLTDERGIFCAYILAHLGAEVIAVEPPGGSSVRKIPPFAGEHGDSLWWQAYSRGKQSLQLDLDSDAGLAGLLELIADADFVIESFTNNDIHRYGLNYDRLAKINPALIVVSITPFGRTGPRALAA